MRNNNAFILRFENGIKDLKNAIANGESIKLLSAIGHTVRWTTINENQVFGAAWKNNGIPVDKAIEIIKSMAMQMIISNDEYEEEATGNNVVDQTPPQISENAVETKGDTSPIHQELVVKQLFNLQMKHQKTIYAYKLSAKKKITHVTIKCKICEAFREIKVQDLFQVSTCKEHKKSK